MDSRLRKIEKSLDQFDGIEGRCFGSTCLLASTSFGPSSQTFLVATFHLAGMDDTCRMGALYRGHMDAGPAGTLDRSDRARRIISMTFNTWT